MISNKKIGQLVQKAREKLGMTRYEIAQKFDCNQSTIWRLEKGETEHEETRRLMKLFEFLEIPNDEIFEP